MSTSDIVGTLAALNRTSVHIKVVHTVKTLSGVALVNPTECANIKDLAASRGEVKLVGPVSASFICPASADFVAAASVAVVPADAGRWPADLSQVAEAPGAANFSVSALSGASSLVLAFDEGINRVLKPRPVAGRQPAFLVGWLFDTSKAAGSFTARFEFSFQLELTGVDWIRPSSWKADKI